MRISKGALGHSNCGYPATPSFGGWHREGKKAQGDKHREIGGVFAPWNGGCSKLFQERQGMELVREFLWLR
jgi:hypothetical protein